MAHTKTSARYKQVPDLAKNRNLSLRLYALENVIPVITHAFHHATGSFPADCSPVLGHSVTSYSSPTLPRAGEQQAVPRTVSALPWFQGPPADGGISSRAVGQSSALGSPSSGGGGRSTGGGSSSRDGVTCSSARGGRSPCGGGSSSPSDGPDGPPSGVHSASQPPTVSVTPLLVTAAHPLPSAVCLSCAGGFSSRGGTSSALGGRSPTGGGPSSCEGSVDGTPSSAGGGPLWYTYLRAWRQMTPPERWIAQMTAKTALFYRTPIPLHR